MRSVRRKPARRFESIEALDAETGMVVWPRCDHKGAHRGSRAGTRSAAAALRDSETPAAGSGRATSGGARRPADGQVPRYATGEFASTRPVALSATADFARRAPAKNTTKKRSGRR